MEIDAAAGAMRRRSALSVDLSAIAGARVPDATAGPIPGAGDDEPGDVADWKVPVLRCVASTGDGVPEIAAGLDSHFEWLESSGRLESNRREQAMEHARLVLERSVNRRAMDAWSAWSEGEGHEPEVGRRTPYSISREVYGRLWPDAGRTSDGS